MNIFDKQKYNEKLYEYYIQNFGQKITDIWYDQPAVNVWVFARDNKIITLKSHILNGEVTEQIEDKK